MDESECKMEFFAEFYLFFCLMVLALGSGFFPEGRLEPNHQAKDIRIHKRPAPFEEHFYLVLMNLCLVFFSRCWFFNFLDIYRNRKKCFIFLSATWLHFQKLIGML